MGSTYPLILPIAIDIIEFYAGIIIIAPNDTIHIDVYRVSVISICNLYNYCMPNMIVTFGLGILACYGGSMSIAPVNAANLYGHNRALCMYNYCTDWYHTRWYPWCVDTCHILYVEYEDVWNIFIWPYANFHRSHADMAITQTCYKHPQKWAKYKNTLW